MNESQFKTFDGTNIFYRYKEGSLEKALMLFHGGHEHSGRFFDLIEKLDLYDFSIFAWDARSHGRSEGMRGYTKDFLDYVRDAELFINHISHKFNIKKESMILMGHSVGSVVIVSYLYEYAANVRGAILGSPAFDVKLYAPFALPALKFWQKINEDSFVNSYVKPHMLTHDEKEAKEREEDILISPKIAVRVLTSLCKASNRAIKNAKQIKTPILLLSAGEDYAVHREKQLEFFEKLGSDKKYIEIYEGFFHEIYHEKERVRVINRASEFINECFEEKFQTNIDISEQNIAYYKHIKTPLVPLEPKYYYYKFMRFMMQKVGSKLSSGIKIGEESGYDSGVMLDYVYQNRAEGNFLIGQWIDRSYLDSIGWRGIRQRAKNLDIALKTLIAFLGNKAHIVDVAAGAGEYLQKLLLELNNHEVTVLCKDFSQEAIEAGVKKAEENGLTTISFKQGDAFNRESLQDIDKTPDIVVVSGLYELFSNNSLVLESLRGINEILHKEGYLIFTNQPTHPQIEFIARTLLSSSGELWSMRLRPQREMNSLVITAGFEIIRSFIDNDGIFTVTIAKKVAEV